MDYLAILKKIRASKASQSTVLDAKPVQVAPMELDLRSLPTRKLSLIEAEAAMAGDRNEFFRVVKMWEKSEMKRIEK